MTRNDDAFKILVVDDNRELREILAEYLRGEGDPVEGADNGKEALEKQRENCYDLIITDLNMPELSGMELIKTIKEENDITEFVIITGYASMDSAVEAIKIGAFDYIVKPFRMEELQVVVKNARDKVRLKKLNNQLLITLKGFYDEMDRYRQKGKGVDEDRENPDSQAYERRDEATTEPTGDTERIVREIRNLEKLRKGRLFID
jgi:DNA-binding NtrC family response regulator